MSGHVWQARYKSFQQLCCSWNRQRQALLQMFSKRLSFDRGKLSIWSSNIKAKSLQHLLIRPFCIKLRNPILELDLMWSPRNLAALSSCSRSIPSAYNWTAKPTISYSFLAHMIKSSTQLIAMTFSTKRQGSKGAWGRPQLPSFSVRYFQKAQGFWCKS